MRETPLVVKNMVATEIPDVLELHKNTPSLITLTLVHMKPKRNPDSCGLFQLQCLGTE